ncbi:DUF2861 family protein [Vibrio sp. SS-MA-C1-2]|uniref:DUF2861 family protein n=1 Tax=Vibrio sp. SS-MA-C1-2 TaxID=2908646 RepID=UPI001F2AEB8A|nr:DUF2861 family protein [Vibrio sp. SS-MA-C1-2]UJF17315.1 DUF2861 family protein [Vibrio sp. SS-MA-C1-2]
MRKYWLILPLLLSLPSKADDWFLDHDQLTDTHQYFLQGNDSLGFESMIKLWQQHPNVEIEDNLIKLLDSILSYNCGVELTSTEPSVLLSKLKIDRVVTYNRSNVTYSYRVSGYSKLDFENIYLIDNRDHKISIDKFTHGINGYFEIRNEGNKRPLKAGFYQLVIEGEEQTIKQPIILNPQQTSTPLYWVSMTNWGIDRTEFNFPKSCGSPTVDIELFDNSSDENDNKLVYSQRFTKQYPQQLNIDELNQELNPGHYWLKVNLFQRHYQGDIIIDDIQQIAKPFELTVLKQEK